jgi:hypothetical protein
VFVARRNSPLQGVCCPVTDHANLRKEWRLACHKLKLGMFDPKTRSYRGAQFHDFRRCKQHER